MESSIMQGCKRKRPVSRLGLLMALAAWSLAGCSGGNVFRQPTIIDASQRNPAAGAAYRSAADSAAADSAGRYDPDYRTAAAARWQPASAEAQTGWGRAPQYREGSRTAYPPRSPWSSYGQTDPSAPLPNTDQATVTPQTGVSPIDRQVLPDRQIPNLSASPPSEAGRDLGASSGIGSGAPQVIRVQVTEIPSMEEGSEPAGAVVLLDEPDAVHREPDTAYRGSDAAVAPSAADGAVTANPVAGGSATLLVTPPAQLDRQGNYQPAVSVGDLSSLAPALGRAVSDLETFLAAHPQDAQVMLALHFLYQVQQRTPEARQVLARDGQLVGPMLELLEDLRGRLARQGDFVISCVKLCSQVEGFGRYREIPAAQLQTGQTRQMYVYCVLENFQSQRDAEGKYVADIHMDVSLFDSRYRVLRQISEDVPDTPSFHVRRDFFVLASLPLPSLAPGRYQLRVQMEDKIAGKLSRPEDIMFEVKAQPDSGAETPDLPVDKTAD